MALLAKIFTKLFRSKNNYSDGSEEIAQVGETHDRGRKEMIVMMKLIKIRVWNISIKSIVLSTKSSNILLEIIFLIKIIALKYVVEPSTTTSKARRLTIRISSWVLTMSSFRSISSLRKKGKWLWRALKKWTKSLACWKKLLRKRTPPLVVIRMISQFFVRSLRNNIMIFKWIEPWISLE